MSGLAEGDKLKMSRETKGSIIILFTAFVWGFCLVGQATGMEVMGPLSFSAVRLTLGGFSMIPLVLILDRRKKKKDPSCRLLPEYKSAFRAALICGPMILVTILEQQYGLLYTSVGKCAFVTAFYIFLVPLLGIPLGRRIPGKMWISVALAMAGLYMITMSGGFGEINKGDVICLFAALTYSIYMHLVETFAAKTDAVKVSMIQFSLCGLVCFPLAAIFEPGQITWANYVYSIVPILVTGIVSCAGGFTLQLIGQLYAGAGRASLILSSETVFSLLAGAIFLNERLTAVEYGGCALMTFAILQVCLMDLKSRKDA